MGDGSAPPAMALEYLPIGDLVPYARNSRTHSPQQIDQVAASIREYGFTNPVLVDAGGTIIAGHCRVMAATKLGLAHVPCLRLGHLTEAQTRAYVIADNRIAEGSGWDDKLLALEISELDALGYNLDLLGFSDAELAELLPPPADPGNEGQGTGDADALPDVQAAAVSRTGEVWVLGRHRVMCGDSTIAADVARLANGERAALLHADPPYGMGKEADGVANDNLYAGKLDAFQMQWWAAFLPHLTDNASAYIWGNAPDLWRLWWRGGLEQSERLYLCNHLTWDKKSMAGMASPLMLQYAIASEHCLFFKRGEQFVGNVNTADYFDGWDPIRLYVKEQATAAGLTAKRCHEITGTQMYGHWVTKSQWQLIPERYYLKLREALPGYFARPYAEIREIYDKAKGEYREHIHGILGGMRSYFDNAHDIMRDVWEFPRVHGEERHGHATPKPAAMMERVMLTSLPEGGLCLEPFGGSGSTLIGAEATGRRCFAMEMQPQYVDVIVRRWQTFTGQHATLENDGRDFDQVAAAREWSRQAAA